MGNPHADLLGSDDVDGYDLARFGPLFWKTTRSFPERGPTNHARPYRSTATTINDPHLGRARAAGLDQACGSAACAHRGGRGGPAALKAAPNRTVQITLPGGDLAIEWAPSAMIHVLMTGTGDLRI